MADIVKFKDGNFGIRTGRKAIPKMGLEANYTYLNLYNFKSLDRIMWYPNAIDACRVDTLYKAQAQMERLETAMDCGEIVR